MNPARPIWRNALAAAPIAALALLLLWLFGDKLPKQKGPRVLPDWGEHKLPVVERGVIPAESPTNFP